MPIMKKMATPPPEPPKQKIKAANVATTTKYKSQVKKDPSLRRRPIETSIYGEDVLKPLINKEKEIVVCFWPFTKNEYRISTEGKFIIERFIVEEFELVEDEEPIRNPSYHWNLYYFPEPINDFVPPEDIKEFRNISYEIKSNNISCLDIISLDELKDKVINFVRQEFLEARQKKLEDLREQDKKYKEDLEELENENELSSENSDGLQGISNSETSRES